MTSLSIAETRDALAAVIKRAESGETIQITRRGKPVAVLVSIEEHTRNKVDPARFWRYLDAFREHYGFDQPGEDWLEGTPRPKRGARLAMVKLRWLLDANVISEPLKPAPNARVVEHLQRHHCACAIPAPVWQELWFGASLLPHGRRRRGIEQYLAAALAGMPILAFDASCAFLHARESARLKGRGRPVPFVDGQIAAIAVVHELTLVTRNTRDFMEFEGLEVVSWFER